jgi:hypothetical protein
MVTALRRFEHRDRGVPDRPGINPFTRQALTLKGRPPRTVRCDVGVDGTTVVTCWTWFEGGVCTAGPHRQTEGFADPAGAEIYASEFVEDLLTDGFREEDAPPVATEERRGASNPSPPVSDPRPLTAAIVEHCREHAWFGSDMMLRFAAPDATERKRFKYGTATAAEIEATERQLGLPLPRLLRELYSTVANGGFGPGYGFVGAVGGAPEEWAKDIAHAYRMDRDLSPRLEESNAEPGAPDWFPPFHDEWPGRVVRVVHWGCAIWSCLDLRSGRVLRYEALHGKSTRAAMIVEAVSFEGWLESWLRGEDLFRIGGSG